MQEHANAPAAARPFADSPRPDDRANGGATMGVGEEAERSLHFADELRQNRTQRTQDLRQVRGLRRVPFQVFGFSERELHFLRQRPCEVAAAEGNRALPNDLAAVGDDEVRAIRADVQHDRAAFLATWDFVIPFDDRVPFDATGTALTQQLVGRKVGQCERRHLNIVNFRFHALVVAEVLVDDVPFHGEQTDFGLHRKAANRFATTDFLEVPDDFFERKRDLLFRFKLHNVRSSSQFPLPPIRAPRYLGKVA